MSFSLVLTNSIDSAHYYSPAYVCVCVCACSGSRAERIFLTFIQILYLIIIRPRVRGCVSCRNNPRGSEGELLFLIRFLVVLFSVFAHIPLVLVNFYIRPFDYISVRIFLVYFTHLFLSRLCILFRALKFLS